MSLSFQLHLKRIARGAVLAMSLAALAILPAFGPPLLASAAVTPGAALAWGGNYAGQLGTGSSDYVSTTPVAVSGLTDATAVAAGGRHSLALRGDGLVVAWGLNNAGQLGNGTLTDTAVTTQAAGLSGVSAIGAGAYHSLAVAADGSVWAWGWNDEGQLGNGTEASSSTPVQALGLTAATQVSGGFAHSLARTADGSVWAWGENFRGQLGNGTTTFSTVPLKVPVVTGIVAVAAGNGFSVALAADGTMWSWGANDAGQLGDATNVQSLAPVQVLAQAANPDPVAPTPAIPFGGVVAIAAGEKHVMALKGDGTIWAWGANNAGQLGNASGNGANVPQQVLGAGPATTIAAGSFQSLALGADGSVWVWGANDSGQLGNGTRQPVDPFSTAIPTLVPGLGGISALSSGFSHNLAIQSPPVPAAATLPLAR